MQRISRGETLDLERGSTVVCIPIVVFDTRTINSIESVVEHTDASVPVIVAGAASLIDQTEEEFVVRASDRTLLGLPLSTGGQAAAVNAALRASAASDFVLVVPAVRVTPQWLSRLQAAARSDSTVASSTPFSVGVGAIPLLDEDCVGPDSTDGLDATQSSASQTGKAETAEEAARLISESSLILRPRVTRMGPGCAYICRAALELVGPLEESVPLDRSLARLGVRLTALGTIHVVADDVLVEGRPVFEPETQPERAVQIEESIQATIIDDEHGPLRRSLNQGRAALRGLSVTIDARALTATLGGTQTYIVELVTALARETEIAVRVLVPRDLSRRAAEAFVTSPDVELLTYDEAISGVGLTDVVHRPQQVFTPDDIALLRLVGERVVVGQQDLIAYHNHTYHRDIDAWRGYRRTTRLALAEADQVIFFSEHARRDALAEDLLPEGRTHVVGIGLEAFEASTSPGTRPDGVQLDVPFILCLGADYAHKNRPFAIELLGSLRDLGWPGRLVLAGAHVPFGSSHELELKPLRKRPDLAELIVDLGPVDERTRQWLYTNARALVYPTLYEGFGLLPFEAARANLPCLFAPQASLYEVAGGAATLVPWDARASAAAVLPLLSGGQARDGHLDELRALPISHWREIASQLVKVYEQALAAPASEAAPRASQELDREHYIVRLDHDIRHLKQLAQEYQDAYHSLETRVGIGLPLIDEGGLLSPDQQRGLMRVAGRGRLGALILKPFGLLGSLASGEGHSDSTEASDGV